MFWSSRIRHREARSGRLVISPHRSFAAALVLLTLTGGCSRSNSDGERPDQKRPNVLLITLDTTRGDRIGCYGHDAARTPNLDGLAHSGVLFEQAYCQVPLTLPSHTSLLTGTWPPTNGIHVNAAGTVDAGIGTLAEVLNGHGYRTGAFISAWVLDSAFGLDRGFEVYDDRVGGSEDVSRGESERRGDEVCEAALGWLSSLDGEPFFAWVHFYDPHHPYAPPAEYAEMLADPYDGEIAFMDAQIGRLLSWLDEQGLRDETLVVAVGDHGEAFHEHGETQHGLFVYDATMRVPLIMSLPGVLPVDSRCGRLVRLVDVMPTVLGLCGLDPPSMTEGVSLTGLEESGADADLTAHVDLAAYGESEYSRQAFGWAALRCLVTADWKFIDAPEPELYDRHADPQELDNVISAHVDEASELRRTLEEMVAVMTPRSAVDVELDTAATERLRSLGYVAPQMGGDADGQRDRRDPKNMVEVYRGLMQAKRLMEKQEFQQVVSTLEPLVATSPESAELRATLGEAYLNMRRYGEAERELGASLLTLTRDPVRWVALGDAQRALGESASAEASYRRAIEVSPNYGQAWARLGLLAATQGDPKRALLYFQRCVELTPRSANAQANLANVLLQLGDPAESVEHFEVALLHEPDYAPAHAGLWRALVAAGRRGDAIDALRRAVRSAPEDQGLVCELAWLLVTSPEAELRNGSEAMALARRSQEGGGPTLRKLDVLAAAYAEQGEFSQAVETMRFALSVAAGQGQPAQALEARLRLYESGRPYRE